MIYVLIPTTKDRRERLAKCIEALWKSTVPITICTYENEDGGFIKAIHNMLAGIHDEAPVFCIGDDVIVDPDCIEKLLAKYIKVAKDFLEDTPVVIQPYDEFHNGAICVNPFCRAWVMRKYQYKGYIHNFADVEFTAVIKAKEAYFYEPAARVEHVHFINDKAPKDDTYKRTQAFLDNDRNLFETRKATNFSEKNP